MKTLTCAALWLLGCAAAVAQSNFVSNPYLPYPPGCAQVPGAETLSTQSARFFDETVDLPHAQTGAMVPLRLTAYRTPCAEPDRSLIWLRFTLESAASVAPGIELQLPTIVAEPRENWRYLMNLATQPDGWGAGGWLDREQTYLVSKAAGPSADYGDFTSERSWLFLLDNGPHDWVDMPWTLSPAEYNAAFTLWLRYPPYDYMSIDVPATADVLPMPAPHLPLSGRQSGIWVIEGADDQGFHLAISEQVGKRQDFAPGPSDLPLVIFFSQYTFDALGEPLWLIGDATFEPGATRVTIPIVRAGNGEFRGGKLADREFVGKVTLTSNSCNDITFEYDFSEIGLGQGSKRLQRLFSLETAGYDCRDYAARVAANR